MSNIMKYDEAVSVIKNAILQSQYDAARTVNEKQLRLYYGIGKYVSANSRSGAWGTGAIDAISEKLQKELPGLRGFSARSLRYMRTFYEEWEVLEENTDVKDCIGISNLAHAFAKMNNENKYDDLPSNVRIPKSFSIKEFMSIGFSHHRLILTKVKDIDERIYYIKCCATDHLSYSSLNKIIDQDDYHHQGNLPNNFGTNLPASEHAFRAINSFKDEYLLDFINVEELGIRDKQDLDEKVVENSILHNIKKFILSFGKDFAFVRNQYHLEAFGEDMYIDLLFFNRELNCLVAVELKKGEFKPSYLGQLQGYLSILDGFERKPHENPAIGLILCKDMNKAFVDYVIQDYGKPMGVATYRTSKDMPEKVREALPDVDELIQLLGDE